MGNMKISWAKLKLLLALSTILWARNTRKTLKMSRISVHLREHVSLLFFSQNQVPCTVSCFMLLFLSVLLPSAIVHLLSLRMPGFGFLWIRKISNSSAEIENSSAKSQIHPQFAGRSSHLPSLNPCMCTPPKFDRQVQLSVLWEKTQLNVNMDHTDCIIGV